jgi:hypothetical protein
LADGVLSRVATGTVLIGHAAESRRSRGSGARRGSRNDRRSGNDDAHIALADCILSGIATFAIGIGHASKSGRDRRAGRRNRGRGRRRRRGDADVVLADSVDSAAGAIGVGHAAKEGRGRGGGGGGDTDVVLTRPACTAVGAVGIGVATKVDIVGIVADRGSRGDRSKCYESEGGEGNVMHREVGKRLGETSIRPRMQVQVLESGEEE